MSEEDKAKRLLELEDLRQEMEKNAEIVASLFSRFRVDFFASAIKKYLVEIGKKKLDAPMSLHLNPKNLLFLIPHTEGLKVCFATHFDLKTDRSLANVFFRELVDARHHMSNTIDTKYFADPLNPPSELKDIEKQPEKYLTGFIVFGKF